MREGFLTPEEEMYTLLPNTTDYLNGVPWHLWDPNPPVDVEAKPTFFCIPCEAGTVHVWHDNGTPNQDPLFYD